MSEEAKIVDYFRENDREMRWHGDELIVFLYGFDMEDFQELVEDVSSGIGDDGGWAIYYTGRHYCVTISELCEYIGMDAELILPKEKKEANC